MSLTVGKFIKLESETVSQYETESSIYGDNDLSSALDPSTVTVITTTKTPAKEELILLVNDDTAGAVVTITFSAPSNYYSRAYNIKKIGSSHNVVIATANAATIDGQTILTLNTQYDSVSIVHNGTNWFII